MSVYFYQEWLGGVPTGETEENERARHDRDPKPWTGTRSIQIANFPFKVLNQTNEFYSPKIDCSTQTKTKYVTDDDYILLNNGNNPGILSLQFVIVFKNNLFSDNDLVLQ